MTELPWGLYLPLLLAIFVYAGMYIASGVIRNRGDEDKAERTLDLAFGLSLLAGAYVFVLFVISIFSASDEIYDLLVIVLIVGGFFGLLMFLLFAAFELFFSRGARHQGPMGDPPG